MTTRRAWQKWVTTLMASTVFVWLTSSCRQASPELRLGQPVIISADFQTQSLNDRVWVSTKLTEKDVTRKDLKTWISRNAIKVSQKKEAVLVGPYRQYPEAWFYAQIINSTNENQVLVADEFNRLRCDGFELYTLQDDGIKKWGSLSRHTPFSKYPLPFFTYALPFTMQANDTLDLVIHTQRHFGVHEVNLNVSNYEGYLNATFATFLTKVFQGTVFVFLFFIMVILGQIFNVRSLTYWGVYILSILFIYVTTWGFTDSISNFSQIGLSGSNIGVFSMTILCVATHLFLLEWMKAVPKNEKIFKGFSYFLLGISFLNTICYLFPKPLFDFIQNNIPLTLVMIILIFINLLWLFYCSILAWVRIKIYYLTLGLVVAYTPFVLGQIRLLSNKYYLILKSDYTIITSITIGLTIVGVYLLREQLVTRKKLEENLIQLKGAMEDIRKNEVEAIGRNLHDNVGNMLASVLGHLNLKSQNPEVVKNLVAESMHEVRFLSHNLVKQDNQPIADKLEMLVSRFNDFSTIRLYFSDFTGGKINQIELSRQENLYMMVQEILSNIIKHSKATEAHIQLSDNGESLQVTIEDDGIGIQPESQQKGIGLKNIYKRAELSAFKITLDSNPTGTNYIIEIYENKNNYRR
jgi:signal transduction histidine kinase